MANRIYPLAKERLLEWAFTSTGPAGGADICVIGVKDTYAFSVAHSVIEDVSVGAIIAPESVIENVTLDSGVVDGDNVSLTGMTTGQTIDAFIVYARWASTTLLLCYMDTPTNGSIPQAINSPAGLLEFDAAGIFTL